MERRNAVIVGGGPAGLAAAVRLYDLGVHDILILEREAQAGGILRQCIHDGFGLIRFGETLSGPEYAQRFLDEAKKRQIICVTEATVIDISPDRVVKAATRKGILTVQAGVVILTMGCRERTRGALAIPGTRPAGVMTAGVAQSYINLHNRMPGKEIVILGSGDIGMIMARRFTLEGAHVAAVFEIMPYPSGLPRNIRQCLDDYQIPLYLSHTVTDIHGTDRVTGVVVSEVDDRMQPIPGTEKEYLCDTLILSVGLIPENELSIGAGVPLDPATHGAVVDEYCQTEMPGIFAAGNVLHVHDLVDFVSLEAENLAGGAARYLREGKMPACRNQIHAGENVGHTVPQRFSGEHDFQLSLRVRKPMSHAVVRVAQNGREILTKKMRRAVPAEMIPLKIPAEFLSESGDLEVNIS